MIACMNWSVCRLPFISARTSPVLAIAAAFAADSSASAAATIL
jgi:hypothetical protein